MKINAKLQKTPQNQKPATKTETPDIESSRLPKLIPVIRQKRKYWIIPRINEAELQFQVKLELRMSNEKFSGTTSLGREIYRKIVSTIDQQLATNQSVTDVVAYARAEFALFPALESEFIRIHCILNSHDEDTGNITLNGMATIIVLVRARRVS